jgi:hypothetical protein
LGDGTLASMRLVGKATNDRSESTFDFTTLATGLVYRDVHEPQARRHHARDILVGYDFLRHFDYVFDYPHGHLIMIPHKQ